MKRVQWAAVLGALALAVTVVACGNNECGDCDYNPGGGGGGGGGVYDGGPNPPPGDDGGTDGGADGGDDGGVDAGDDGGTDGGDCCTEPGAQWPSDALLNYSEKYNIPAVQSVGIDDGLNIWVLKGREIGVIKPDTGKLNWGSNIGQASQPFGESALATGSSVICGGAAGKAYVGYLTTDGPNDHREGSVHDYSYKQGDMDLVRLNASGQIELETHLTKTTTYHGIEQGKLGIRNTNDWHFDEDRSVFSCIKATRGPHKGDVFMGSNHGVTRIRGDTYNAHIHPVWYDRTNCTTDTCQGSMRAGYTYALSLMRNGNILIGNDWMLGLVVTTTELADWERESDTGPTRFRIATHVPELNSKEEFDNWRGVGQLRDPSDKFDWYFMGSKDHGLWKTVFRERAGTHKVDAMIPLDASGASWTTGFRKVPFATDNITAMQHTDDNSLFIGTGDGLYRMRVDGQYAKVAGISGSVKQLVYDPSQSPSMLMVLTSRALYVMRGH